MKIHPPRVVRGLLSWLYEKWGSDPVVHPVSRSTTPVRTAGASGASPTGSAIESLPADDSLLQPTLLVPGEKEDEARAEATQNQEQREAAKNRFRTPILIAGVITYLVLSGLAVLTVFRYPDQLENLLKVYALIMPVLTGVIGASVGYIFGSQGQQGGPAA